jgi:uncharacterized protein (TIGR02266 family)
MTEERRSARRARIAGVRVTYESAAGERVDADTVDLSRGGLFVRTARPLAVGKRIAIEITVIGEPAPWSALGRVVWIREKGEGDTRPPGMGVKMIDVDDAVVAAIDRMVDTREPTEPGVGAPAQVNLEPLPPMFPREPSIPIDLLAKRSDPPPSARRARARAALGSEPAVPAGRGSSHWLALVALLAVAGVAGYVLFDGIVRVPPRAAPIPAAVTVPPAPAPPPAPPPATETASAPSPAAGAAGSLAPSALAPVVKRSSPGVASTGSAAPPPSRGAPAPSKKTPAAAVSAENPY